jgi:hypothetical protein
MGIFAERAAESYRANLATPTTPLGIGAWADLVTRCAEAGWRTTALTVSFDTAYRLADAALRTALPELVPQESTRQGRLD